MAKVMACMLQAPTSTKIVRAREGLKYVMPPVAVDAIRVLQY